MLLIGPIPERSGLKGSPGVESQGREKETLAMEPDTLPKFIRDQCICSGAAHLDGQHVPVESLGCLGS